MKRKVLGLVLSLVMCLSVVTANVFAEDGMFQSTQTCTISIPEMPGLEITMSSVYDMYACYLEQGNVTDKEYFFYLDAANPTLTFNTDALLDNNIDYFDLAAGDTYTIPIDEDGYGNASMIVGKDGEFINIELVGGDYSYANSVRIVFMAYNEMDGDFHAENLILSGLSVFPISELVVGGASEPSAPLVANPTASTVLVNGENVAFDAYNINDNNYFKLRDLAHILNGTEKQFDVGWDGDNNAISLTSGQPYTVVGGEMEGKGEGAKTPTPTNSKILLNGAEVSFTAYNIDGNNYFKLRDIGAAFDFGVDWDGERNTIVIDTSKSYTAN